MDFPIQVGSLSPDGQLKEHHETISINPSVGIIPTDILDVDLTALEGPLRQPVYATDEWITATHQTRVDVDALIPLLDNPYSSDIEILFSDIPFSAPTKHKALLKYHMNADKVDFDVERKFPCALQKIIDHGTPADQEKALIILGEAEQAWKKTVGSSGSVSIQWGGLQLDDCETFRCASGPLIFIAHYFGEWLEIPVTLSRKLMAETEIGGKQFPPIPFCCWNLAYGE